MDASTPATPAGSRFALVVLLALVVLTPWPFGSVHLRTTQVLALVSLSTALVAVLWDGWEGRLVLPDRAIVSLLAGVGCLALFQLVPLPRVIHEWLAPGSAFIWHPLEPAAAAALGPGPHPLSIAPDATRRWLSLATGFAALVLAALPALRDRRALVRSSVVIAAGGFAVATFGLVARVFLGQKLYGVFEIPTVSSFGPFVSKNHFAGYVEMTAILALGLAVGLADRARSRPGWLGWTESPRAGRIVFAWGVAAVLVLTIPASLSRGGVVSLVLGVGVFVALRLALGTRGRLRPARRALLVGTALALSAAALAAVLPDTARQRVLSLTGVSGEESGGYRLDVWRDSLRLAASSPAVGMGFGAYEDALPPFKTSAGHLRVEHAENDYLELLVEGGLAGGLLGLLALLVFRAGWRTIQGEHDRLTRAVRAAAMAAIATLLVHGAFDFNLRIPSNVLLFAALGGLAMAPPTAANEARHVHLRSWPARTLLAALGAGVLLALTTSWDVRRLEAQTIGSATAAGFDLRRTALTNDVTEGLRRRPAHAPAWVLLAWLRLPDSEDDARSLSRWGSELDPQHETLQRAAERVQGSPASQ